VRFHIIVNSCEQRTYRIYLFQYVTVQFMIRTNAKYQCSQTTCC